MKNITAPKGASFKAQSSRKPTRTGMKLRFGVNQAECFRRGINSDKSIVTVEVDPSALPQDIRNLIADRLDGIDVVELDYDSREKKAYKVHCDTSTPSPNGYGYVQKPVLIEAVEPTWEALLDAVRANAQALSKAEALDKEEKNAEKLRERVMRGMDAGD